MKARTKARTIDEYLAALTGNKRAALVRLRKTIRAAAPEAEECISYQLPAFRQNGMLVFFGASENHCSLHMDPSTLEAHKDELEGYDTSKGTIRFQPDDPLPVALVRKLVRARIAENASSPRGYGTRARRSPAR
ncbi:MAG: iron chaperone [Planctomycetota bacterium]